MTTQTDAPIVEAALPSVQDFPDRFVLIYDGYCKFCIANVRALHVVDASKVAYISLHDPIVSERWPELSHDDLMKQIYLIDKEGGKHPGAAAFRFLSCRLPALWILAPLLHIPFTLPFWQVCYRAIARIRYRFGRIDPCENGTCSVHFD